MKNICIKSKEIINYNDYKLSILITQDGLSYSLYSISENKYYSLVSKTYQNKKDYLKEFDEFISEEKLNYDKFNQVNIVTANNKVTIIPSVLFNDNDFKSIYNLNFEHDNNVNIFYSKLQKSSTTIIFSVENILLDSLNKHFSNYNLFSHSIPFIEINYTKNKVSENRDKTKMFVQVFESFIDILIFENENLLLYNTYTYKTSNDLLYFIINVFEQLKLSQEDTEVSFSGFIETDDLVIINLRKFVKLVYFESQSLEFKYFYKFQETLPHYFINFLNINKCE